MTRAASVAYVACIHHWGDDGAYGQRLVGGAMRRRRSAEESRMTRGGTPSHRESPR